MRRWSLSNAASVVLIFAATALIYNSLVTGIVLTNHTIPNTYNYPYPSYKTVLEGRWLADIIVHLLGGGGQVFQAALGFGIQALNGMLFADLLRVENKFGRLTIGLIVALYPAVLDSYSFIADNVSFTVGQTLVICGALVVQRRPTRTGCIPSAILIMLGLACYQPMVGVAAVAQVGWIAIDSTKDEQIDSLSSAKRLIAGSSSLAAGLLLYFVSSKVVITSPLPISTALSSVAGAARQLLLSYATSLHLFIDQAVQMPWPAVFSTLALPIVGSVAALVAATRRSYTGAITSILYLTMIPPAAQLVYVINDQSSPSYSRFAISIAYALAFFAALAIRFVGRWGSALAAASVYGFAFLGIQENTFLAMHSLYEENAIRSLVGRIASSLPNDAVHPIVVVGEFPTDYLNNVLEFPNRPLRPDASETSFAPYRQVPMLNFFAGRRVVTAPSKEQIALALSTVGSHPSWPAADSVYLAQDVVVAKLSAHQDAVTWANWPSE